MAAEQNHQKKSDMVLPVGRLPLQTLDPRLSYNLPLLSAPGCVPLMGGAGGLRDSLFGARRVWYRYRGGTADQTGLSLISTSRVLFFSLKLVGREAKCEAQRSIFHPPHPLPASESPTNLSQGSQFLGPYEESMRISGESTIFERRIRHAHIDDIAHTHSENQCESSNYFACGELRGRASIPVEQTTVLNRTRYLDSTLQKLIDALGREGVPETIFHWPDWLSSSRFSELSTDGLLEQTFRTRLLSVKR